MVIDIRRTRNYLKNAELTPLFVEELGWDYYDAPLQVTVDGHSYPLQPVAHKRGFVVLAYHAPDTIPDYATRRKIERRISKSHREHIIIYLDGQQNEQIWQWVLREPGRSLASREHRYDARYHDGESLVQKLREIAFTLDEEEDLTLIDVTGRVRASFDVERATRSFYRLFQRQRDAFQKFLEGIPNEDLERWYVSVMLNRLMFIYFIQKKGFLDNNPNYLSDKLEQIKQGGEDRFYNEFLCPLFFMGFAVPENQRPHEIRRLLGRIPYLNGGIFQKHQVEHLHGETIRIPDRAFEKLFDFFEDYQWHLDDRPLRNDREINPDVLGYIFEKYINQKQMGAYYTKEDITGYISQNTIIPYLFDQARRTYPDAFSGDGGIWSLLSQDPDRYIYEAVRKGCDLPLPEDVAAGLDDVAARTAWNDPTPDGYALPTEIWRETIARRQRYEEVWLRLVDGQVQDINDLITYNLDIQQFARDVIHNCDEPETLRAFWKAINSVTVLDPTCGSGAFLFAALNILEPLYQACLDRMEAFVEELPADAHPAKFSDFKKVLEQMKRHPNEDYFILKSIIVNNLYGVDIMHEAVEIAKLRLFLKLVSQIDRAHNIEPLPDIDFNIRSGNTLVGFTTKNEVEQAMRVANDGQGRLMFGEDKAALERIEEKATDVDRLFTQFRNMQTSAGLKTYDAADFVLTKDALRERLGDLEEELNCYLAVQYGIEPNTGDKYQDWLHSHQPFHWFIEFYGILKDGGFDIVIGNPPYIEYYKVRKEYQLTPNTYSTERAGNLYAYVIERSNVLLHTSSRMGMIVQMSAVCTERMQPLQDLYLESSEVIWTSNYDDRPAKLFDGLEHIRATIIINVKREDVHSTQLWSTQFLRWYTECRPFLFSTIVYAPAGPLALSGSFPKVGNRHIYQIIERLHRIPTTLEQVYERDSNTVLYYHRSPLYWIRAIDFLPHFRSEITKTKRSTHHLKDFGLTRPELLPVVGSIINSSLFYLWFIVYGNGRNVTLRDIHTFPLSDALYNESSLETFSDLFEALMSDYQANSSIRKRSDGVEYQEFSPSVSKSFMDAIDAQLAKCYELTDEELEFVINYDIKYRMGDELFED